MVTGWSYRDVRALFPTSVAEREGLMLWEVFQTFAWFGYALRVFGQQKYAFWPECERAAAGEPFADVHVCEVVDFEGADGHHLVVMLADGSVLDPLREQPRRLSDYHAVVYVAGVYPIDPRPAP